MIAPTDRLLEDVALLQRQGQAALRALLRPGTYVGTAVEAVHALAHVAGAPLVAPAVELAQQALADGAADAPGDRAEPPLAARPVILVHGYVYNRSAFTLLRQALHRAGFEHVHVFTYSPTRHDVPTLAAQLGRTVDAVLSSSGATRCGLVGHSMGGIIARYYVEALAGAEVVDTVVTLGTPHAGTYTALWGVGPAARQMVYGSDFLEELERRAEGNGLRYVSYYSDLDAWVVPAVSAKLTPPALRASNLRVRSVGHLSMVVSSAVVRSVVSQLAHRVPVPTRFGNGG